MFNGLLQDGSLPIDRGKSHGPITTEMCLGKRPSARRARIGGTVKVRRGFGKIPAVYSPDGIRVIVSMSSLTVVFRFLSVPGRLNVTKVAFISRNMTHRMYT